ncbi:tripartite tricarboxylate transporter TctB family protein [Candidatus Pelagibacter sp. HIMB1695]|jgi:hypothetical protein|uniref:tripartite tricarboxylate transporter TctB family protein n=1 Tax=Candidatus Pelagibacter sp. HIMB1695 TaxID=3413364 RepID=UPI003F82AA1F|tara:strand:- start:365 stop:889 length:525 start_codon:yes stop_codon:yes gene_type:complete
MKLFYKLFFSKQNLLATIFLITLILYFISSFDLEKTIGEDVVGPSSFPILVATFGFLLLTIYFLKSLKTLNENDPITFEVIKNKFTKMAPIFITIVFVVLFELIGFLFSSFLYSFLFILYLKKTIKYSFVFSAIITLCIFIIFYYGLNFQMPMGELVDTDKLFPFLEDLKKMIY